MSVHDRSKDAIFCEVHLRGFYDLDGDGVGDFRGLIAKLDYLNGPGPSWRAGQLSHKRVSIHAREF
jgi:hypothetical protein